MTQYLDTAKRAARVGGRLLRDRLHATREIRSKGKRDIVTDADYAAEKAVRQVLAQIPHVQFLSEESDPLERKALWAEATSSDSLALWVVDPLDGTTNYARCLPVFGVSIGLYQHGVVQVGVVYDPIRNELFAAERGQGATLNGQPIAVSGTQMLDQAVHRYRMATGAIVAKTDLGCCGADDTAGHDSARVRKRRSIALYVAAGRFDAYFHYYLSPWDVAAAG